MCDWAAYTVKWFSIICWRCGCCTRRRSAKTLIIRDLTLQTRVLYNWYYGMELARQLLYAYA